jgi:hypothetical protein
MARVKARLAIVRYSFVESRQGVIAYNTFR